MNGVSTNKGEDDGQRGRLEVFEFAFDGVSHLFATEFLFSWRPSSVVGLVLGEGGVGRAKGMVRVRRR